MVEPCIQCGHSLAESLGHFHTQLHKIGGLSYGSGKEYCINCWLDWFNGRHHYDQPVTVEITHHQDGCLAVSCCAFSGQTILTKHGLDKNTTVADLRNWLNEDGIELRQDRDGRFYTVAEYIEFHFNNKWLSNESEDARRVLLTEKWKQGEQLRKSAILTLPNAQLLPRACDSEPLGKFVDGDVVALRETVVYVGEPRKVPGGRVLEQGTRGFVCEAKDDQFRVCFKELGTGTVRCSSAEFKRADASMNCNLARASDQSTTFISTSSTLSSSTLPSVSLQAPALETIEHFEATPSEDDIQESERQAQQEENTAVEKAIQKSEQGAWQEENSATTLDFCNPN